MTDCLILRPSPGAQATAARAQAQGLLPHIAPLFTLRALDWKAPAPDTFDALLLTSANAVRLAGAGLTLYRGLPVYAVGDATAAAAREAGFSDITIGEADGAAALARAVQDQRQRLLHLVGREHIALAHPQAQCTQRIVYAADALEALPDAARAALAHGAIALLHSPRAAALFAVLVDHACLDRGAIAIAAISPAIAAAAGQGWRNLAIAAQPNDKALLAAAAGLCDQTVEPAWASREDRA